MSDPAVQSELTAAYADLTAALDRIATVNAKAASDDDVLAATVAHETAARRMSFYGHQRVLEVSDRGLHIRQGFRGLTDFMIATLRITNPGVRRKQMAALLPMTSFTGEELSPQYPRLAEAFAEGAIGPEHAQRALDVLARVPAKVSVADRELAEKSLADAAREYQPKTITTLGARILAHLDPDGSLTDDRDRARQRGLCLGQQDGQSMSSLRGSLDPMTRALFEVLLDCWAAPGMNNPADEAPLSGSSDDADAQALKEAAARDVRTQPQRNHDALKALLKAAADGGLYGHSHRGLPAHLIVTITESELRERAGVGDTAAGAHLPITDLVELAANAHQHLAVFKDHTAEVLYQGRAKRCATPAQRFALLARDGNGCTAPDCTQPFTHCEIHHADKDWADGGSTDIDKLAAACPKHNRRVGPEPGQWATTMLTDGPDAGRPAWTLNTNDTGPPNSSRINRIHHAGRALRHRHSGTEPAPPE